ncbi:MAG: polysaccharide biosynthesis/export family protein [Verrucomicrobiales bacterium]|nr:polysaccharide biosynthesis/export family protein [Verrucomicrobiales bacterium]
MNRRVVQLCLLLGAPGVLGGAVENPASSAQPAAPLAVESRSVAPPAPPAAPASEAAPNPVTVPDYIMDDKHRLLPGDRVSFFIKEDRTNAIPLVVTESSELDIPYIGRMSVAGKTCRQLAAEVKAALEKDYYHQATVIIGLDALGKVAGKVLVVGRVKLPGPVEIPPNENFTVGRAILKAGGFSDFANMKRVQIVRKMPDGATRTIEVNLRNVFEEGRIEEDVPVEPNDLIIVPKRGINF